MTDNTADRPLQAGPLQIGPLQVGIAGLGAIGLEVAKRLDAGIPGLALAAVAARDHGKATARLTALRKPVPACRLEELPAHCDVVVECLPATAFRSIAVPTLEQGRMLVAISAAALLEADDLPVLAKRNNARILLPSGAMMGLDAVAAMAEGEITAARLISRKPPAGLRGAPYLVQHGITLDGLSAAQRVFQGSAREAARAFPANVNVAATLSLAGIGPDRTQVEVWADPALSRNTHAIEVVSDSAILTASIENLPIPDNPKSSRITALSIIAALRRLTATLRIGV